MLANDGLPQDRGCLTCQKVFARWRCQDCGPRLFCRGCCRERHRDGILHRIEKWTGTYFKPASLHEVGVKLSFGHQGNLCPKYLWMEQFEIQSDLQDDNLARQTMGSNLRVAVADDGDQIDTLDLGESLDEIPDDTWADDLDNLAENGKPPRFCPKMDEHNNPFIIVVDVGGFFAFPALWCECGQVQSDRVMDLLDRQFFPASFKDPQTAFTFKVLQDFRLANLEMKSSAYQYHQKLRRSTNAAFPHLAPNRYAELVRTSREWRNLLHLRWNGFGFKRDHLPGQAKEAPSKLATPGPGDLGLFCAACPQPGINLRPDWQTYHKPFAVFLDACRISLINIPH